MQGLGDRLGVILVQLPPSLAFSEELLPALRRLRDQSDTSIQCEPRHASRFTPHVDATLAEMGLAGSLPIRRWDPALTDQAAEAALPISDCTALRLYVGRGTNVALETWSATALKEMSKDRETWVILDNRAAGFARENAFELQTLLDSDVGGDARFISR